MNTNYKIEKTKLSELDYYFFRYMRTKGGCIDGVAAQLQLAIALGNGDYIQALMCEHGFKDLMEMAVFAMKAPKLIKAA
jgi:hypothetical protein